MYTKWCSVFADEEWRLVHVDWAVAGGKDNNQNDSQDKVLTYSTEKKLLRLFKYNS